MADLPTFQGQFPEFSGVPPAMLQSFLTAAALEIDLTVWSATSDQATYYLAAHRLCCSPFGQNAKMSGIIKGQKGYDRSTYGQTYRELQIQVSSGYRVC